MVELRSAREPKDPKGGVGGGTLPQQAPVNSSPSMSPSSLTEGQVRQSVWRRGRQLPLEDMDSHTDHLFSLPSYFSRMFLSHLSFILLSPHFLHFSFPSPSHLSPPSICLHPLSSCIPCSFSLFLLPVLSLLLLHFRRRDHSLYQPRRLLAPLPLR